MNKNTSTKTGMEIAVIGMAGKFPKAENIIEYWENLKSGKDCITFFSDDELHLSKEEEALKNDPNYVKAKGYLEGKEFFDEKFFEYSKSEAEIMEPQMRLFHQCVWAALEDAGLNTKKDNPIGVYGGASSNTYWKLVTKIKSMGDNLKAFSDEQLTNEEFMCTKIAYKLNLKGPAVYVKTACSTSMAAIHIACRGLLTGECKVAAAGGVSLLLPDKKGYFYREGMIFSPDGYCRAFDDNAHGTVGGEGVGVVVLKRLRDAEADGDRIYAVIKGSAMNNDGAERIGYTAPGVNGQATVIKKAYRIAKVAPETVSYIEAHGTGTELGDPIEIEALKEAFATTKRQFCALGSVKSNIGHLDSASGVAGFIKCVLSLYNKVIPPTIHYENPNRKIDFENSPFYVNTSLKKWEASDGTLRAGISSFGMGGTNVHVVLENYEYPDKMQSNNYKLLMFSAKSGAALKRMLGEWKKYLSERPEVNMSEIAHVLENKRSRFIFRKAVGCSNAEDAVKKLESVLHESIKRIPSAQKKIVFMFPGQGNQYVKMCFGLYSEIAAFRAYADYCFELQSEYSCETKKLWLDGTDSDLMNTTVSQPLIFIMEYCIARLLMDLGIKPDIVIGYSFGDYAAACIAGVISLKDALFAINKRAQLMQKTEKGVMLNIPLERARCEKYISLIANLSIAIDNGGSCIIAGGVSAIEECEAALKNDKIMSMRIGVDYGSHSHLMIPIVEHYAEALASVEFHENEIPMISCVTGEFVNGSEVTKVSYWSNHLKECVKYYKAVKMLDSLGDNYVLIETGPGRNLLTMALRGIAKEKLICGIDTIRVKSKDIPDVKYLYDKLGNLYDNGIELEYKLNTDISSYGANILPNYPFEKNSFGKQLMTDEAFELGKNKFASKKDNMIYMRNWERSVKLDPTERFGEKWIVFADKNDISEKIVSMISKKNKICACVQSKDFSAAEGIISELFKVDGVYNILYTYGLAEHSSVQRIYCDNLFKIANLCGAADGNIRLKMFILCSNSIEAVGCDLKYPDKAMLSAAVTVIPQEYSNIDAKLIDLDNDDIVCNDKISRNIYNEICSNNDDKTVAYRRNYRMLPTYTVVECGNKKSCIKEGGIYILFGGMGGIGQVVAKHMARKYNAKLVLSGRKNIANGDMNRTVESIGNSEYILCDISSGEAVEQLFRYTIKKFGKIDGVFNMTAVSDGCLVQMRKPEDSRKVIAPKYDGTRNLINACKANGVEMMVLFSSLSSIVGSVGQAAYCAANAYLDACAYYNENFNGIRTVCINWDRWRHTGISNKLEQIHFELTGSVMDDGLDVENALELFDRCMCIEHPLLIALSQEIGAFFVQGDVHEEVEYQSEKEVDRLDRSTLSSEYAAAETATETKIVKLWEQELSVGPIGICDDFLELGGDSLKAIIMLAKIEKIFGKKVLTAGFLTEPTIKKLAVLVETAAEGNISEAAKKYYTELDEKSEAYVSKLNETTMISDAYYLSPMQNITLSYNIMHQTDGKNVAMFECIIRGNINIDILVRAWQAVVAHNPVLRSTIVWRKVPEPIQIIRSDSANNVNLIDLSGLNDDAYAEKLVEIHDDELSASFRVTDYPLHRMKIVKRSSEEYRVIVSYMNSLFDGWSTSILLSEIQNYYLMLKQGTSIKSEKIINNYFAALKMQRENSKADAGAFWKDDFSGFEFTDNGYGKLEVFEDTAYASVEAEINEVLSSRILEYAKAKKITVNSYFQGCWAILISEAEQSNDVVSGYVSSGRDMFSEEMLETVGLFTNIVPLRTRLNDNEHTDTYFVNVHKHINSVNQNSILMMPAIENIVGAPKDYFEQIPYAKTLTLVQYPVEKSDNSEFTVENVISDTSVNVPLRAYVLIGKSIKLKLQYSSHYSKETVSDMLGRFVNIAENGIENQLIRNIKLLRKEYV